MCIWHGVLFEWAIRTYVYAVQPVWYRYIHEFTHNIGEFCIYNEEKEVEEGIYERKKYIVDVENRKRYKPWIFYVQKVQQLMVYQQSSIC